MFIGKMAFEIFLICCIKPLFCNKKNPLENSLELLRKTLNSIYLLNENDWLQFASVWKPFSAKRKETLTIAGEKEKYLYFVLDGIQRVYYINPEGKEATIVFTYAPSFGGVVDSLMLQEQSKFFYETLTPSAFLRASYSEINALTKSNAEIEFAIRTAITQALSGVLERLVELQIFSSEEKFRTLLKRSPHILQLIPHKYLANYMGIDATNFSKLLNKIRL